MKWSKTTFIAKIAKDYILIKCSPLLDLCQ
jgi:hypothetical protein